MSGCKSSNDPSSPTVATASVPPAPSATAKAPEPDPLTKDGELKTSSPVAFEVRGLNGPGTMGPTVLAASSDKALEEIRAYLVAHPNAGPLRIEASANPLQMSSGPNPRFPASLAQNVARWLVDHGIDCKRLEVIGFLDRETQGERVRFYVGSGSKAGRPPAEEARLDPCAK